MIKKSLFCFYLFKSFLITLVFLFVLSIHSLADENIVKTNINNQSTVLRATALKATVLKATFLKIDNISNLNGAKIKSGSGCALTSIKGTKLSDILGIVIIFYLFILSVVAFKKKRREL